MDNPRPAASEGAKLDADCDRSGGGGGEGASEHRARRPRPLPQAGRRRHRQRADRRDPPHDPPHRQHRRSSCPVHRHRRAPSPSATTKASRPPASSTSPTPVEGPGSRRPVTFLYNGGPGSSSMWLHMGSLGPVRVATDSPRATHNAPFDLVNNSDSLLDKSDLVFVDAIGGGILPAARRHQARRLLGHRPRHRRLRPGHRALPDGERPLELAQVHLRRELRHHPLRRSLLPSAVGRRSAQRRDPALVDPELRPARSGLRPGADQLHPQLRGRRRLPPPAPEPTRRPDRLPARGAGLGARPLRPGPGQGPGAARRRAPADRPADERLHRPVGRLHPGQRPARLALALPQGAAARPAPDPRPLRRPLHRRGRGRRRRQPGVRSVRHRHHRRLRLVIPPLSDQRPRLHERHDLSPDLLLGGRSVGLQAPAARRRAAASTPTRPTWRSISRRPCARTRTCCSIR